MLFGLFEDFSRRKIFIVMSLDCVIITMEKKEGAQDGN
jgi:hypothetical protein